MRLALLKTGSNGQSQILTPRFKNLEHRYMDRSSPLTPDYTPWRYFSDSNITIEFTGRGRTPFKPRYSRTSLRSTLSRAPVQ